MNTSAFGVEKATLIRVPATANLMIDSNDRAIIEDASGNELSSPYNFQIAKAQPLINGYFSRVGTTEVVVEYCADNVSTTLGNSTLTVDVSGIGEITITVPPATYTVAGCLDAICQEFNDISGAHGGTTCAVVQSGGQVFLEWSVNGVPESATIPDPTQRLAEQLDLLDGVGAVLVNCPDLRPYRYWDFVCENLTQVQDVKDASTATYNRDVLCRWYFAWDESPPLDAYGFPILMGYTRFCARRTFNPPKQIKWEQNVQVGNLTFSVWGNDGNLVRAATAENTNWLMTLQLSEG